MKTVDTEVPEAIDCGAYLMLSGVASMRLSSDEYSFDRGVYRLKRDFRARFYAIFQHPDGRLGLVQA